MTRKYLTLLLIAGLSGMLISCSSSQQSTVEGTVETSDNYTTAFPSKDVSNQLNRIQKSILRVISTAYYSHYTFSQNYITLDDLRVDDPEDLSTYTFTTEESTAGTSILLKSNKENALAITCRHVVSFPDTIITYRENENIPPDTYIKSISIKDRQVDLIFGPEEFHNFNIIASDPKSDLALLTSPLTRDETGEVPLDISLGNSDYLQNGSFLYIMGFPKGYAMITRGIASTSENWRERFFVTDSNFNPGISGGLVIASNSNFDSFQWIGMAKSSNADKETVLVPRPDSENYERTIQPYQDSTFVQQKTRISYGITQAIPINQIKEFLEKSQNIIRHHGFQYPDN